jgi:lambda family phage portal protein
VSRIQRDLYERRSVMTPLDRFTSIFAPRWTLERVRARAAVDHFARHYEAAQVSRRTSGWNRARGDANAVTGAALAELRMHARDLVRNTGWARRGRQVIANSTVGWGIVPRPEGQYAKQAAQAWKTWANATTCEASGRHTFYSLQALVMRSVAESGEVLIRRRPRRVEDGLPLPLQLQVLEADYLDTSRDAAVGDSGGPIIQGVEFDAIGRRKAYWLFTEHPGNSRAAAVSKRVPAVDVAHIYYCDRPGQVRGPSWFGAAIVPLKELDDFEDAELMRQKIAACFAAFITDVDGQGGGVGETSASAPLVETLEPGMMSYLPPGKSVTMANPPTTVEGGFSARHLRKVAAALGVTFEDLTGDYSQVNYSSARMARLSFVANVRDWQWNMIIPQLCAPVWKWAMEAAELAGAIPAGGVPGADWTAPPLPMIDPDKEADGYKKAVRAGMMTPSEMVREQGGDPATHWGEYARDMGELDALGIKLSVDVRAVSDAGLTQERAGAGASPPAKPEENEE